MKPTFFESPLHFREWLEAHHGTERELWVGFYKKATGKPSITWRGRNETQAARQAYRGLSARAISLGASLMHVKTDWPNFYKNAGSPDGLVLIGFKTGALKPLQGKSLAEISKQRGRDPIETLLDLLVEDESGIGTAYFVTAEENIKKLLPLPWVSFGSDEAAQAPD
jgi:N-acyl-D-aspartate/D-glutamate deacylase